MTVCLHCGCPVAVRNASGYCDHLYFPDNCGICTSLARVGQETVKVVEREGYRILLPVSVGDMIDGVAARAISLAAESQCAVLFIFNDIAIVVGANNKNTAEQIVEFYETLLTARPVMFPPPISKARPELPNTLEPSKPGPPMYPRKTKRKIVL